MNKSLLTLVILGLLTLFTSAYYSAPADGRMGYKAPALFLGDSNNDISPLHQHSGDFVLLTFWSSDAPQSRLENRHYDRLSRTDEARFTHVSVCMDRSASVFKSVLQIDDLDRSAHFCASIDAQETIIKSWRLEQGYHSFLIDPQGNIAAIDPDENVLAGI